MATCKDCLYSEACYMVEHYGVDLAENQQEKDCAMYKDKTKYVEVIRCKECKWCLERQCKNPYIHMTNPCCMYTYPTDFCSYGERKEPIEKVFCKDCKHLEISGSSYMTEDERFAEWRGVQEGKDGCN